MNNEGYLIAKEGHISFFFNDQTSSYESQLTLHNQASQPAYFHIVSTFGRLLSYQNHSNRKVQSQKSVIIDMKLKIPNQIKKHEEIVRVSYSKKQLSSKVQLIDDQCFEVKVTFEESLPQEDQMITQILKGDCEQLCHQAGQLLKNGFVKKALNKYEESFLLYRQLGSGLCGMAECLYLTQSWHQALQQIETALILHSDKTYIWLKLKIVFEIIKDEPNNLQVIKGLKKQIKGLTDVPGAQEKKKQMLEFLLKEQDKILSETGGKYVAEFIQRALTKFDEDLYLKSLYKNVADYEKQLLEVLGMKKSHTIQQAPQYILDPITYQIMQQPLIVPSGHSFDQKSLLSYMSKHGNKDLFTRQQLRYEWARPNTALQSFIKKNDHLKQWIEFEREISTFK